MWFRPRLLTLGPTLGMSCRWKILMTDASLMGWGAGLDTSIFDPWGGPQEMLGFQQMYYRLFWLLGLFPLEVVMPSDGAFLKVGVWDTMQTQFTARLFQCWSSCKRNCPQTLVLVLLESMSSQVKVYFYSTFKNNRVAPKCCTTNTIQQKQFINYYYFLI